MGTTHVINGIPPEVMEKGRRGHYGLQGMRERARRLGAELNVWSGAGTEVELKIPAPVAYGTFRGRVLCLFGRKREGRKGAGERVRGLIGRRTNNH